jgi:hypothetical protein
MNKKVAEDKNTARLQASWYHITKGQYFTDTQVVGIDFQSGMFDGKHSYATLVHETTHAFLCNATEMGIFLQDVEKNINKITSIPPEKRKQYIRLIFKAQQSAQEGFSTFFQFGILKKELSKTQQKYWLSQLPETYQRWLKPFLFAFDLTKEERDFLTGYLIRLTMNTHIRKDAEAGHLLESVDSLSAYLADPNNNPANRLRVMLRSIKENPAILHLKEEEIPVACGLQHFPPIGRQSISDFIYYLSSKIGNPVRLTAEQIGDAPSVDGIFAHVQDNTIVANLNMNFKDGVFLYRSEDVVHYADVIETVLVAERGQHTQEEIGILRPLFDEEPEISLMMQAKTGEKYIHLTSRTKCVELINNNLQNSVLGIKLGDYNYKTDSVDWLNDCRNPNLVIFNHHWQIKRFLEKVIETNPSAAIVYCNMAPVDDHHYRSFLCTIDGKEPVFGVNTMIPTQADVIISSIKTHANASGENFVLKHKPEVNSWLIFWTGWDFRIDWVATMLDGTNLHFK